MKFRAWDGQDTMIYFDFNSIKHDGLIDWNENKYSDTGGGLYIDNCDVMQYTGLQDKTGRDIFDGDIVGIEDVYHFIERDGWKPEEGNWKIIGKKSRNFIRKEAGEEKYIAGYRLKVVRWEKDSCGFEPFSDSEENCGCCGGGDNPNSFEVLGNIYENPELLDNK